MFRSFATSSDMTLTLFAAVEALGLQPSDKRLKAQKGFSPGNCPMPGFSFEWGSSFRPGLLRFLKAEQKVLAPMA
jgi:hypothetical protein